MTTLLHCEPRAQSDRTASEDRSVEFHLTTLRAELTGIGRQMSN